MVCSNLYIAYFMGVNMKKKIMCKCENLIVEELDEGVIILNNDDGYTHVLNEMGGLIWANIVNNQSKEENIKKLIVLQKKMYYLM